MPKATTKFTEIDDIKQDLASLKDNVVELTKHITQEGMNKVEKVEDAASDKISDLSSQSRQQMQKLEKQVKEKPAQSIAIAFATGILASMLLNSRR